MDLVEEQDRAAAVLAEPLPGALDAVAHVLDAGGDRRHLLEGAFGRARDRERQRRLAGTRRSPEDRRRQPVELDEAAQRAARSDEVLLADDLVDGPRPDAGGERRLGTQAIGDRGGEQVVRHRGHATERHGVAAGARRTGGVALAARARAGSSTAGTPRRCRSATPARPSARSRTRCRRATVRSHRRRRRRRTTDALVRGACCRARGAAIRRRSSPASSALNTTSSGPSPVSSASSRHAASHR